MAITRNRFHRIICYSVEPVLPNNLSFGGTHSRINSNSTRCNLNVYIGGGGGGMVHGG